MTGGDAKFKVGDRVRVVEPWDKTAPKGFEATVTQIAAGGVWFPTEQFPTGAHHYFAGVELVEPAPTPVPTPPPNTVLVRIAVAVDADGRTESRQIRDGDNEDEIRQIVAEDLLGGVPGFCRVSAITAHVPMPEQPAEIQGTVEQENADGNH